MSAFRAQCRAAAVSMLSEYAQQASVKLQIYPGRPRSINPPTAFIDTISEVVSFTAQRELLVQVRIVVLHGLFDSKDTADQADQFVDDFIDWAWRLDNFHKASAESSLAIVSSEDDPSYTPEWMEEDRRLTYFATTMVLEGRTYGGV